MHSSKRLCISISFFCRCINDEKHEQCECVNHFQSSILNCLGIGPSRSHILRTLSGMAFKEEPFVLVSDGKLKVGQSRHSLQSHAHQNMGLHR